MPMAEGLFLGVGFSCYGRRALQRGRVGRLAGSAAPYSFSECAHQLPALLWENECACLAGGALDTIYSLLPCAYACVFIRREHTQSANR